MALTLINELFRKLFLIYWALAAVQILSVITTYLILASETFELIPELDGVFQYFTPVYAALLIVIAQFLYARLIKAARKLSDLALKLMDFRRAVVLKISILAGLNMLVIMVFLLTGLNFYFYIFMGVLILYFMHRPIKAQLSAELELSEEEEDLVRGG